MIVFLSRGWIMILLSSLFIILWHSSPCPKISCWDDMEVPEESFHWSSWDSRTCYPRRAFIQGLTDDCSSRPEAVGDRLTNKCSGITNESSRDGHFFEVNVQSSWRFFPYLLVARQIPRTWPLVSTTFLFHFHFFICILFLKRRLTDGFLGSDVQEIKTKQINKWLLVDSWC